MSSTEWEVMGMVGSVGFRPFRRGPPVEYGEVCVSRAQAQALADVLNGRPALKRGMSQTEFYDLAFKLPMQAKTRNALHDILVLGRTWKVSAKRYGVTESGILRAMRRLAGVSRD